MQKKTDPKPCECPCPKCGSSDVYRIYRQRGEEWDKRDSCCVSGFSGIGNREWKFVAWKEHIEHHCRCCQFAWGTKVLPKPKASKKDGTEQETTETSAA